MTNARHSMDSPDWMTPVPYVKAAREVMGGIDLDPASDDVANRTVKATQYYTPMENGLDRAWRGRVFLNPPGGLVREFWLKLMESPEVEQCVWIGYSVEQLQYLQAIRAPSTPLQYPLCFPRKRIAFVKPGQAKNAPSHANYVAYIGPNVVKFCKTFAVFGQWACPYVNCEDWEYM